MTSSTTIKASATALGYYELVAANADWKAENYDGVIGIRTVTFQESPDRLIVEAEIDSDDLSRDDGEISLLLTEALDATDSLDMSQATIEAVINVPIPFSGYFQVFVNDELGKSQYGEWVEIGPAGVYRAGLSPTVDEIPGGYTDANFDPTRVSVVGISFGSNTEDFQEQFVVNHFRVYPNSKSVSNE